VCASRIVGLELTVSISFLDLPNHAAKAEVALNFEDESGGTAALAG